jgi:hypothetical protein
MTNKELSRQQKWYYENKERSLENDKKWRRANPEKVSERNRRYRETFIAKYGMPPSRYYKLKKSGGLKGK